MKYKVVEGSESHHCCFTATVVEAATWKPAGPDFPESGWYTVCVCECFEEEVAQKICDALNKTENE